MRVGNALSILMVFGLICASAHTGILAQSPRPSPQISLLKEDKSSPFIDGKTIIAEVNFTGLDIDDEVYGFGTEDGLYESNFLRYHANVKFLEGEKFSTEKIGSQIRFLKQWLASEGYLKADVVAYGTILPKGRMKLTFSVVRGIPLDPPDLDFIGNRSISTQEFIDDFKSCSGHNWERYAARKYEYFAQRCSRQLLFSRGFFKAKVNVIKVRFDENRYLLTIGIYEGTRYKWGEIKIEGAEVFSENEMLEMFGQISGDVADGEYLKDFVYEKLKQVYNDRGYVQYSAEFDPSYVEPIAEGLDGTVNVLIIIDEGRQYKVNRIEFVGVDLDEQRNLKDGFPLKPGDIYTNKKAHAGIEAINKSGDYLPLDKDRDLEIRISEERQDIDLVIKLRKVNK